MFPTIGHLFSYLTGVSLHLPVPTFGFFMVLSFAGAWWVFRSEYKRKETEGLIHPFIETFAETGKGPGGRVLTGRRPVLIKAQLLGGWGLLGFLAGFKGVYWWVNRSFYIGNLSDFLFSFRGNLAGGIVVGLAAAGMGWFILRQRPAAETIQVQDAVHPYQLMDRLLLACGIAGFAGAILFAKMEGVSGLNYYGALIAGALTYLYINWRHGIPLLLAADIGSPGMMLAYGVGRIGCHLAGDGDWGIANETPLPAWLQWLPHWTWSCYYPHNSIHQGVYIPGCPDNYCTVLPVPVYPTSFYEAVICLLLFIALWALRRKIKKAGVLFAVYALLNGAERLAIEYIRVNPRYSIGGWKLSQAQLLALGWIAVGLTVLVCLRTTLPHPSHPDPQPPQIPPRQK
ncbi:MAG TPA: prolipoprotein diacylglyceryl transferase family protein [Puia sp.]|jgi:phosphatidylglycerol:prolipoprotein diacylglycerol transferase|nr:prolipoprotein diacylglyceryl transferase family protein [Puia sp.]